MKTPKFFLVPVLIFLNSWCLAQVNKSTLPDLIKSGKFVFEAHTAIPMGDSDLNVALRALRNPGGGVIYLDGSIYEVQVSADSVEAFLPYYGRAFSSMGNLEEQGIKFNSKKFNYQSEPLKKGGWRIQIETKDVRPAYRLSFDISRTGSASLHVRDFNRQAISFYGDIVEIKPRD